MARKKYWETDNMPERRFEILSTATLPFDRISGIPDSVNVRVVPFIQIISRSGLELIPLIAEYAAERRNVVFTSAHAVKFVSGWLKQKPDWNIYCVRNETRSAVVNWFGPESGDRFATNALYLSRLMIADGVEEAIFFCGDKRLDTLPDNLRNHGIRLTELVVYDTRLSPVKIKEQPEIVLFFSPTAVKSFFSMNELSSGTVVFAMGKTTEAALKHFTSVPIHVSPEADKAFVLNLALEYAALHPVK
jgi:uroporphyrinogen-III synthase